MGAVDIAGGLWLDRFLNGDNNKKRKRMLKHTQIMQHKERREERESKQTMRGLMKL